MNEKEYCPCCDKEKPMEDGDYCHNIELDEDSWICRDCIDNGKAEEEGWE